MVTKGKRVCACMQVPKAPAFEFKAVLLGRGEEARARRLHSARVALQVTEEKEGVGEQVRRQEFLFWHHPRRFRVAHNSFHSMLP
jgi:hypothetical protein